MKTLPVSQLTIMFVEINYAPLHENRKNGVESSSQEEANFEMERLTYLFEYKT